MNQLNRHKYFSLINNGKNNILKIQTKDKTESYDIGALNSLEWYVSSKVCSKTYKWYHRTPTSIALVILVFTTMIFALKLIDTVPKNSFPIFEKVIFFAVLIYFILGIILITFMVIFPFSSGLVVSEKVLNKWLNKRQHFVVIKKGRSQIRIERSSKQKALDLDGFLYLNKMSNT